MTIPFWRFRLQLFLAIAALAGGALAYAGASLATAAAPAVSAASVSACSRVSLKAIETTKPASSVALTATADCSGAAAYAFFDRSASTAPWILIRGWGGPTFTAATVGGGPTQYLAWATDGSKTVPQVQSQQDVTLASNQDAACTSTSIDSASDAETPGQRVAFTASADCPVGADVEYSYFERSASTATWTLAAAWVGPNWSWTAPTSSGVYQVLVWASDGPYTVPQAQSSTTVYDGVSSTCTAVLARTQPSSGGSPSSSLTLSASSTCPQDSSPEYSYFVGPSTSGPWTLVAAWVGPSWTWNPATTPAGTKDAIVWVSDGPFTIPQAQTTVALKAPVPVGCSTVTPSTAPGGSAAVGTAVSVDASATCTSSSAAEYSYFTGPTTSGPWTLQAAWIGPDWTWNTTAMAPGTYSILVWASDGPYTVPQVQAAVSITLAGAAPIPVTSSPLANPTSNLTADFGSSCWPAGYQALACEEAEVADIDSALASEGLQPLSWTAALYNLSTSEQEFVVTNQERVLRGLAPITGMDTAADQNALAGAQAENDPRTSSVPGEISAVGNWAEDYGPLGSDFDWMYNDGPGSFNIDCPSGSTSDYCWVHRDQILTNTGSGPFTPPSGYTWVAGDACIPDSSLSYDTICDLEYVLIPSTSVTYDFTWAQAVALGA